MAVIGYGGLSGPLTGLECPSYHGIGPRLLA
jgi:hypothetical protein